MTDFSDLDSLLAESMADRKRADAAKAQRKVVARMTAEGASAESVAQARQIIHQHEAKFEWETVGKTAVFIQQRCQTCGALHTTFSHWMLEQRHREMPSRKRQTRVSKEVLAETNAEAGKVPVKQGIQHRIVELCWTCIPAGTPIAFQVKE